MKMGIFLNSTIPYDFYKEIEDSPYFVDKTLLLEELLPRIGTAEKYICITRPRRFGKSVMANMIASFLSKGKNAGDLFDHLKIAASSSYARNLNQYNVITISFNKIPNRCRSYEQYIDRIENRLKRELIQAFPDADLNPEDPVWDILMDIYTSEYQAKFIFVLDEWDFIFHRDFVTDRNKADYIDFLSALLKDMPYVLLAYMTGILPVSKYSSGSELNMFLEYTMASEQMYSSYFGFTETEVDELFSRYLRTHSVPRITREGLKIWYDGYHTKSGERVYNPRSVTAALINDNLGNYWTSSGPYDEIFYYVSHNTAAVREDIAQMMAGFPVSARVREYAATCMNLTTKDEIFSAMVVYGFLSYEDGCVSIPNRELMDKFREMLLKESSLGYIHRLAKASEKMLEATIAQDTKTMTEILEFAHDTESPLLSYSSEAELTTLVNLIYLKARDRYRIEREDKTGRGYADFIFYPDIRKSDDCIILELKVDHTAEEALQQIRDRKYALKFQGSLGREPEYRGRILGVGIAYFRDRKAHECKVEVLREALV